MLLRDSQVKCEVQSTDNLELRIVSTAENTQCPLFSLSLLKALEDTKANTAAISKIYKETYNQLASPSVRSIYLLRKILGLQDDEPEASRSPRTTLLNLSKRLAENGIEPIHYSSSFLSLHLSQLTSWAHRADLFKIPIPGSHSALGLSDFYEFLEKGEVYIRAGEQTVCGKVLIYRDPIFHIGDIQEAKALSEAEAEVQLQERYSENGYRSKAFGALKSMDNVIFFSLKESPSFPSRLARGDLDGDRFEILTKTCSF